MISLVLTLNWSQDAKPIKDCIKSGGCGGCCPWVAQWFSACLGQGVILESRDQVPYQAPCMEPASPSACVSASHCVSLMNK